MVGDEKASGGSHHWHRVAAAGGFVAVDTRIDSDAGEIEIVKTYADCAITALFFRAPRGSRVFATPTEPPDLRGGFTGGITGDLHVMSYGPVRADRTSITVVFGRDPAPWDEGGITIPVDRRRTARHDRRLAGSSVAAESGGVRASLIDV